MPYIARRSSPSLVKAATAATSMPASARSQAASMRVVGVTTTGPLAGHDRNWFASRRTAEPSITPGRSFRPKTSGCSMTPVATIRRRDVHGVAW